MTKTTKIVYAALLVLIAALLAVGGVFDLTIANNVYQPDNVVARILELVGYLPPFLLVAATFAVLFYRVKEDASRRALKKVAAAACVPLAYLVFGYMMSGEVMTVLWQRALVAVGSAAVLTAPTFLFFRKRSDEQLKRYEIFLIFAGLSELPTDATPFSPGIKTAVIVMFCVIPMLAWVASLWALRGYSLSGNKM